MVEHNILASRVSLELFSQGGAFVNNLFCGTVYLEPVLERPTPYHVPHSTQVAGYAAILGGDDRYIGNIFLGGDPALAYGETSHRLLRPVGHGTAGYDGHPPSLEAYLALVADPTRGDHERFRDVKQPVFIRDNVYAAGAKAYEAEQGAIDPRRQRRHRRGRRRRRRGLPGLPPADRIRHHPRRHRQRSRPRTRPLRRRRLRGTRRHPDRPDRRPRRSGQDLDQLLPARPAHHPDLREPAHPRLVDILLPYRSTVGRCRVDLRPSATRRRRAPRAVFDYLDGAPPRS